MAVTIPFNLIEFGKAQEAGSKSEKELQPFGRMQWTMTTGQPVLPVCSPRFQQPSPWCGLPEPSLQNGSPSIFDVGSWIGWLVRNTQG